ncbi:unnamed protein product [Cochlearia groenlandica]
MDMYYDDHVAVSETEIGSFNFCTLVDAAVMLYEEEEEDREKRLFCLFPRRKRSSLSRTRRRNLQLILQNLKGSSSSSTSSSSLLDLNTIAFLDSATKQPRNQFQFFSSLSLFLGDHNKKSLQNPLQCLPSSSKNPPNPNSQLCLTENKSRKRRAEQVKEGKGKSKKAKVAPLSWIGRDTPERLTQLGQDPKLIFEKTLTETDVNPLQSRLLMPLKTMIRNDFLTPLETRIVEEEEDNEDGEIFGVGSVLFDVENVKWGVIFKRRDMNKCSGKGSLNYALICGWNDMVKANGLKDGDSISVWSLRLCGLLCFAIVPPPATE